MKKERKVKADYELGKKNAPRSGKRDAKAKVRFEDTQVGYELECMLAGEVPARARAGRRKR